MIEYSICGCLYRYNYITTKREFIDKEDTESWVYRILTHYKESLDCHRIHLKDKILQQRIRI